MHLRDLTTAPPGMWNYTQPQSGLHMKASTFRTLLGKIAQHRLNMRYPTEGRLSDEIEDAICRAMSPENQQAYCITGVRNRLAVPWQEVESFLKSALTWLGMGKLVPQDHAEWRASICATCPLNVGMRGCGNCRVAVDTFRSSILKRSTSHDDKLQACGVCGCELKTAVHAPLEALEAGSGHLTYPSFCWRVLENRQTTAEPAPTGPLDLGTESESADASAATEV